MPHTVLLVPINVSTLQSKRHGVKCGEMQSPAELSPKMKSSKDTPECTEDATGTFIFIFLDFHSLIFWQLLTSFSKIKGTFLI